MAFLRAKTTGNRTYYYLVNNHRISGKVRQKVLKYLGKNKPSDEQLKHLIDKIKEA